MPGSRSNSSSQGKSLWTCTSGCWSREGRASSVRTWSRHCWKRVSRSAWSTTLSTGRRSNLAHLEGRYDWIEGDLADFDVCRRAVEGVACVFHQAAIPSVPRSVREPLSSHASGPTATLNLLEAARQAGVRRFIFAASSSAYGETTELPKHEDMLPQPLSPYAAGKLAGEAYVSVYARTMGLDGVSLRYFNIFGPRQDPSSPYSGVISLFTQQMSARPAPDHLRRRDSDPRFHLCGQCRGGEPRRASISAAARGGRLQRRNRPANQPPRPGRGHQHDPGNRDQARVPARPCRGCPRFPGQSRSDPASAELSADR